MKILITGFGGFVSSYFIEYLSTIDKQFEIIGVSRRNVTYKEYDNIKIYHKQFDLKNQEKIFHLLKKYHPQYILHLASESSVAFSWSQPIVSFRNNTNIFLNLLDAVRLNNVNCKILSVGSSEEYGNVNEYDLPLLETSMLNPISPYAVARVSQEMLSDVYNYGYGLNIVKTRSFNHFGPSQSESFVISSFAKQIVKYSKNKTNTVKVGNLNIIRDFLDVRDVVRAYYLLLIYGEKGELYNVCSGHGYSLNEIINSLFKYFKLKPEFEINPELLRPVDNPVIIGNNDKLRRKTGWKQLYSLNRSLEDIIKYWENNLS